MSKVSKQPVRIATHEGVISLGEHRIECAVLEDGSPVLRLSAIKKLLGHVEKNDARTFTTANKSRSECPFAPAEFLLPNNILPFASHKLQDPSSLFNYQTETGRIALGCKISVLPALFGAYLRARRAGKLKTNQMHIAQTCEILQEALAEVGRHVLEQKKEVAHG